MKRLDLHRLDYASIAGFVAYSSSAVVTPVCLLVLAKELGFSLTGGGGIEVARTSLLLVVLLVSGLAAAWWGKVRLLGAGALLLAAGLFLYAAAPTYGVVLLAVGMVGLGSGILEALINPLIQDLHPDDSGRYLNLINGFWSVGVLTTVLVVGELLTRGVSWRLIMAGTGLLSLLTAGLFLYHFRADTGPTRSATQALAHVRDVLRVRRFWHYMAAMFFGGGAEGSFTFWSASYAQLRFGGLPRAGGFSTACFAGGMIVGRFVSSHAVEQKGLRSLILLSAAAGFVVSLFVPAIKTLNGLYGLLFFAGLSAACFWPSIQSYAADRLDTDSTMLFILLSCAGIPGFAVTSWLMGWIGDRAGLNMGFFVVPGMFAMLIVAMLTDGSARMRPPEASES